MQYSKMKKEELEDLKCELKKQYDDVKSQNLKLNMARGKPSPEQLELSMDMLNSSLSASDWISEDGTDVRNYGGLDGIPECKKLFADELGVAPECMTIFHSVIRTVQVPSPGAVRAMLNSYVMFPDMTDISVYASISALK